MPGGYNSKLKYMNMAKLYTHPHPVQILFKYYYGIYAQTAIIMSFNKIVPSI